MPVGAGRRREGLIMTRCRAVLVPALLALCLTAWPAQAQLARTFVSSLGNDANDCQRQTPCRTFQGAHDQTLANGEITVLDPGGYGAVTITKAISIINDGVGEAGMLISGGLTGITINAGANDAVSLRGLTLKGLGAPFGSGVGISFRNGKSVTLENCTLRNLTVAVSFDPLFATGPTSLAVTNTVVADSLNTGISIVGRGLAMTAVLDRVEVHNSNTLGLQVASTSASGSVRVTVSESVIANSGTTGISVGSETAGVMVSRSMVANNGTGIGVTSGTVRLGASTVTGNGAGWSAFPNGSLLSYGDNNIDGNTAGEAPPPSIATK